MARSTAPRIRELDRGDIDAILARNHVGRIAYSFRDRVDMEPIHYIYEDGWIYGRTSPGTKLSTIRHNYWVAFEVDEIDDFDEWRSVVVHGGFYLLPAEGTPQEREARARATEILRRLVPGTLTGGDPTPGRLEVFRIAVQEAAGRESRPVPQEQAPPE